MLWRYHMKVHFIQSGKGHFKLSKNLHKIIEFDLFNFTKIFDTKLNQQGTQGELKFLIQTLCTCSTHQNKLTRVNNYEFRNQQFPVLLRNFISLQQVFDMSFPRFLERKRKLLNSRLMFTNPFHLFLRVLYISKVQTINFISIIYLFSVANPR